MACHNRPCFEPADWADRIFGFDLAMSRPFNGSEAIRCKGVDSATIGRTQWPRASRTEDAEQPFARPRHLVGDAPKPKKKHLVHQLPFLSIIHAGVIRTASADALYQRPVG